MSTAIVFDSALDIPSQILEKDYVYIVPVHVIVDGKSHKDTEVPREEVHKYIEDERKLSTSQPSVSEFVDMYEKLLPDYDHIISMHLSKELSGTYNSARLAQNQINSDKLYLFDTGTASIGGAYFAEIATRAIEQEFEVNIIMDILETNRNNFKLLVIVEDVSNLHRSGRINLFKFFFLRIFRILPILTTTEDGFLELDTIGWGLSRSIKKLKNHISKTSHQLLYYGEASSHEFNQKRIEKLSDKDPIKLRIGSALTVHTGPTAFGIVTGKIPDNLE